MNESTVLVSLFSIRAHDLFRSRSKTENYYFLSGLLIGGELKDLLNRKLDKVYLCAEGFLSELYSHACEKIGLGGNLSAIPSKEVSEAVIRGQGAILQNQHL